MTKPKPFLCRIGIHWPHEVVEAQHPNLTNPWTHGGYVPGPAHYRHRCKRCGESWWETLR